MPSRSPRNLPPGGEQEKYTPDGSYSQRSSGTAENIPDLKQYHIPDVTLASLASNCRQNPTQSGLQIVNRDSPPRRFSWGAVMPLRLIILFTYGYLLKQAKNRPTQELTSEFDIDKVLRIPLEMQTHY